MHSCTFTSLFQNESVSYNSLGEGRGYHNRDTGNTYTHRFVNNPYFVSESLYNNFIYHKHSVLLCRGSLPLMNILWDIHQAASMQSWKVTNLMEVTTTMVVQDSISNIFMKMQTNTSGQFYSWTTRPNLSPSHVRSINDEDCVNPGYQLTGKGVDRNKPQFQCIM